jgi:hypothetical protein
LVPPESTNDASSLPTPFQSVGARGANNLSAKLLLALFPPGSSFFRLQVDEFAMEQLIERSTSNDARGEIDAALAKAERAVMKRLEQKTARPVLSEMFKHLIVAGNALLYVMESGAIKLFTLANYVVKRDGEGEPIEIVCREGLNRKTLPPAARLVVESHNATTDQKKDDTSELIYLYTWIQRQENKSWKVHQEVVGMLVPGTDGTYPAAKSAWIPLRWTSVAGSDYGRGHVEEYMGDLHSLEGLSQSVVEFAANASKIIWLVDEGGVTSKRKLQDAPSGAIMDGKRKDVEVLMMEKFADFQVVSATADKIERRLEQAFLLNSSIQRQAERVTAEEIRFMAGELEQALGGTYSILGQELQHPLVTRLIAVMQRKREFPQLPEKIVTPQIITGLDGLGRTSDLMKLDLLLNGTAQIFGPEAVAEYASAGAYITRRAAALNIEIDGLVRSEEQVQASRQQKTQQAMMEKLGPQTIKAMSDQSLAVQQTQPTSQEA